MSEKNTFKEAKKPLTIKVSTLVPYSIIVIAAAVVAGFIIGSQYQIGYVNDMNNHAEAAISALKAQK